jgi:hypothetical protein
MIQDVSDATFGKRAAQFNLIEQSLRSANYERESSTGKTANLLDAARLRRLDDLVELGLEELSAPGAAVPIVQVVAWFMPGAMACDSSISARRLTQTRCSRSLPLPSAASVRRSMSGVDREPDSLFSAREDSPTSAPENRPASRSSICGKRQAVDVPRGP